MHERRTLPSHANAWCAQGGMKRISDNFASRVKKGGMSAEAAQAALARVKGCLTYDEFKVGARIME